MTNDPVADYLVSAARRLDDRSRDTLVRVAAALVGEFDKLDQLDRDAAARAAVEGIAQPQVY